AVNASRASAASITSNWAQSWAISYRITFLPHSVRRHAQHEAGALAFGTICGGNPQPHRLGKTLHDRKTKPGAALAIRTFQPGESFKHAGLAARRQAGAFVKYGQIHAAPVLLCLYADRRVGRAVFGGILYSSASYE
ncbi:hypothetical protein E4T56_gene7643, partial [Termitomyces sp. T112]